MDDETVIGCTIVLFLIALVGAGFLIHVGWNLLGAIW